VVSASSKLAKRAVTLPSDDPRGHVVLGSLVNLSAAERMDELIADAKPKRAVVAAGKRNGAIVDATMIDRVTTEMRIYKEESLGPVKPVICVKADDAEYGLSSAVFSRDVQRALPFGQTHRVRNLPHQWADRARRRPAAVRRRQSLRLRSLRREDRHREFTDLRWDYH
jgi:acyl-CoA reductase-like NAD-dependent aldehyde dehydrogenase